MSRWRRNSVSGSSRDSSIASLRTSVNFPRVTSVVCGSAAMMSKRDCVKWCPPLSRNTAQGRSATVSNSIALSAWYGSSVRSAIEPLFCLNGRGAARRRIVIESPHAVFKLVLVFILTMTIPRLRSFTVRSIIAVSLVVCACAHAERFNFVALGDTPYFLPADYAAFERLIARVNTLKPAFTLHVGDIISGQTRCDDALYSRVRDMFATFEGALVYTPGDNEWTDCHRPNSGRYDPLERLARVRELFFPDPTRSLGRTPLTLTPQSVNPRYAK